MSDNNEDTTESTDERPRDAFDAGKANAAGSVETATATTETAGRELTKDATEAVNEATSGDTVTSSRYRWKYLSTLISAFTAFSLPSIVVVYGVMQVVAPVIGMPAPGAPFEGVGSYTMGAYLLAWTASIGYAVGIDTLKDAKEVLWGEDSGPTGGK